VKVRVLSPAIEEIAHAAFWYDLQRRGLGYEFWQAVDDVLAQIEENPLRFGKSEFATSEFEFRSAVVGRFGYVIHYLVGVDEIVVVAVAHGAREPGYWLLRVRGN
jgi:hypothetical protein